MIRILAPLSFTLPLLAGLPSPEEALGMAFPGSVFTRRVRALTPAQGWAVEALAGTRLAGLEVTSFEARRDGVLQGTAFLDTHRVRAQAETALVAVSPEGKVLRVEVIALHEPAPGAGAPQGRRVAAELSLRRSVHPLTGATLTADALAEAARRGLALHQVLGQAQT